MSNELSLYGITEEIKKLDLMFEKSEGEVTEEMDALEAEINALLVNKVDACVGYRKQELDLVELAEERIKQLKQFIETKENKIERFDTYVMQCMAKLEKPELKGLLHSIKIRKPSKSVLIQNENEIPAEFVTIEQNIKISKSEISKALKEGREVAGACLVNGKPSLNIK